jgi:rhodanese-related sulfurtransferase
MKNTDQKGIKLKKNEIITLSVMGIIIVAFMFYMLSQNMSVDPPVAASTTEVTEQATEVATEAVERINTTITPEDAVKRFGDQGINITNKEVYLIDVRTVEEYAEGHIPMSLNIPLDKLESIQAIIPYADKTLIVYCRSGNRSAQAVALLSQYGYNTIYDLGGIQSWPFEIVK